MLVNILVGGRFHSVTLADALSKLGADTTIYTSAPPSRFRSATARHRTSFVPMPLAIASKLTGLQLDRWDTVDTRMFDRMAAIKMRPCDVLHGWAGYSLHSARRAKRHGSVFMLERSCPHVDFQEELLAGEAERLEVPYRHKPRSWMDRSRAEYELADYIVVPSAYSRRSFLERGFDESRVVMTPLDFPMLYKGPPAPLPNREEFVVGTLGGSLLRKGFLYLLEAWEELALPNARLLLKAPANELRRSPRLRSYLDRLPNVEVLGYIQDISAFYRRCDVFCLASVDEGFGLAMLEALSNGVPVIVTENVGAGELLPGSGAGFVVPIRSSAAIAERISALYEDHALRAGMAGNALTFSEGLTKAPGGYFDRVKALYRGAEALRATRLRAPAAASRARRPRVSR